MKIGIDARFYRKETGGIGRYTRALLEELAKIDKTNEYIVYITPEDNSEYVQTMQNSNLKSQNFRKKVIPISHYSLSEQTKFLNILKKDKLDLVHFANFNHPIFYPGKFITTIHDLTMMLYPAGKSQKSLVRKFAFARVMDSAAKNASAVIAVSKATKDDVVKVLKADPKNIEVIYEGIDKNYNAKKTDEHNIKKSLKRYNIKKPYLLFLSQWRPHKGILQLLEAFDILKQEYLIDHQLVIVGKPNNHFPEIPNAISKNKYKKDIITPGFVDEKDLPILYQNADCFVFPSHYEGFGLPPIEAMACGAVVAASNVSCMPEVLGDAAAYFDPYSPEAMAEMILKVIKSDKLKNDLRAKGLEQVKKYSWAKMAKETLELYKKVVAK